MRTTTLFVIQTVVVIGYLACTSTAEPPCCRGRSCHEIPAGCDCPFKAYLCTDFNPLTMGKRKSQDPYQTEQSTQQQYQLRRTQQAHPRANRRLDDDRVVSGLSNLLKLLKQTHQADQEAFDIQDQNENDDWETVPSSRKLPSKYADSMYQGQLIF